MQHLLLKAATSVATDEGIFEAVISTATVDRDKDIVEPSAMVNALAKWAGIGKLVPLAWAHGAEVVGHVDPGTARIQGAEVIAKGWVDQSIPRGEETWRLVKSGTLSFSFGFLIPDGGATKRRGGGLHIKELDVFEISVVPAGPANNDTRVLSFKSAEELREDSERIEREVAEAKIPDDIPDPPPVEPEPEIDLVKELQEVKARLAETEQALEILTKKAEEADKEPDTVRSVDPLRKRSEELALEIASGGMSLRRPPTTVKEKPEPVDVEALRRESRDRMFEVLSYSTE